MIRTRIQAPNANAHAERWVRTVRNDCLDGILILGRGQLEHVSRIYATHYNERRRPHRSLRLQPPAAPVRPANAQPPPLRTIHRRDLLGGLIHGYARAAWSSLRTLRHRYSKLASGAHARARLAD